jgi:UDP-glucuronate decarboxylase
MLNSKIIQKDCEELAKDFDFSEMKNKIFMITGSNGFIGNYIVNFLDTLNRIYDANIRAYCISKTAPKWKADKFIYLALNLTDEFKISIDADINYIIHGACYATPAKFLNDPIETIELNTNVTHKLLRVAKVHNAKFLFLSSGAIYGDQVNAYPAVLHIEETDYGKSTPYSIRAPYIESKRLGETLCNLYHQKVARLGYIYGPGNCEGRVMSDFIDSAVINKNIHIMTDGSETRSYCYITDALKMMLNVLLKGNNSPYNIDGDSIISIKSMAELVAKYFGITCEAGHCIPQLGAPMATKLDNRKVCTEFNITKFVPFEDGLNKTIEWSLENVR